jgi:hypothetical protein
MATTVYKRLCEVRILHDYYLSKPDLTSIYALNQNDQTNLLKERIALEQYDIRNYLEIIPSAATLDIMKNYAIRMALLPSGFLIGVKVKPQLNGAGEEEYLPALTLTDGVQLGFRLKFKKANFNAYTNLKIQQSAPVRYYFTNNNDDGLKIFPSLSRPVSNFLPGKIYETGELALIGGKLKEAREDTSNPGGAFWNPVKGMGLANEQDRILLPKLYPYTFSGDMTTAEITLKKPDGSEVKKIQVNNVKALQTYYLNFRQTIPAIGKAPENIEDGRYLLEISGDTSTETILVFLSDELYQSSDMGALVIETNVTDELFRVLKDNGTLITKKKADGTFEPHPVYEIRFKRRSTYWRYRSDSGGKLKAPNSTNPFLQADNKHLVTKELRALTFYPTFFEDASGSKIHLPTPKAGSIIKDTKRLFSDIYISPIKGLIEIE